MANRTGFNKHDTARDACQLFGAQARQGYDWWWHSFTGYDAETGVAKPFFIEFFLCNPALGEDEPVFGQIPGKPQKPSYLMVKAGAWGEDAAQLHRFWGWKQIKVDWGVPFAVEADDCFLTENCTHGHVKVEGAADHPEWMCQDGEMIWNLKINKITAFNVGFGADEVFRHAEAFEMFWHAEGMKTEYKGEVVWNGRKFIVRPENCYGYADKNWGKDFTSPWVWLSSNNLTSKISGKRLSDSVFDIGGGRPKIGHLALPRKLLSAFWYEGKPYEFNFSKAWTAVHTEFDCKETDTQIVWHVEQRSTSGRMVTDVTCEKKDMLLVNYESPDGAKRHNRLWNGGNGVGTIELYDIRGRLIDRIHAENIGCEYGEYDLYTVINLGDYELSGGGKLGKSYTHRSNPDVLLKLYSKQLEPIGMEEHERARKVFRTGVPCPEPGELVRTEDGRLGILYKRIIGKKSYARALSEHPEWLEEYAENFAAACKKLHSLKPEPGMFPTAKDQYKKEIERNPFLTEEERDGLLQFIDGLPDADTCVHGDLHHGNVIFTPDGAQYFIDLSDFCIGTPLFDLGIIMLQTCWLPEETERELYHIGLETSRAFWNAFVPAYFGAGASMDEVQAMLQPYAFLRILVSERLTGTPISRIRPPVRKMIGL